MSRNLEPQVEPKTALSILSQPPHLLHPDATSRTLTNESLLAHATLTAPPPPSYRSRPFEMQFSWRDTRAQWRRPGESRGRRRSSAWKPPGGRVYHLYNLFFSLFLSY